MVEIRATIQIRITGLKKYACRNVTTICTMFEALISFAIMILWGAVRFPTGMILRRERILFNHTSAAFSLTAGGIVFDNIMGNDTPYQLLVYSTLGFLLYGTVLIIQIFNYSNYVTHKITFMIFMHVIAVTIFFFTAVTIFVTRVKDIAQDEEKPLPGPSGYSSEQAGNGNVEPDFEEATSPATLPKNISPNEDLMASIPSHGEEIQTAVKRVTFENGEENTAHENGEEKTAHENGEQQAARENGEQQTAQENGEQLAAQEKVAHENGEEQGAHENKNVGLVNGEEATSPATLPKNISPNEEPMPSDHNHEQDTQPAVKENGEEATSPATLPEKIKPNEEQMPSDHNHEEDTQPAVKENGEEQAASEIGKSASGSPKIAVEKGDEHGAPKPDKEQTSHENAEATNNN